MKFRSPHNQDDVAGGAAARQDSTLGYIQCWLMGAPIAALLVSILFQAETPKLLPIKNH